MLALVALLSVWAGLAGPVPAAAASGPKVAIIVGPSGSATAKNREWANAAAREARGYTSNIVKVYSPNATWTRVKAAITGASIVVYFGRGLGFPSPGSSTLKSFTHGGFGLNPVARANNTTTRFYGERYIRTVRLAPKALVILDRMTYASGNSAPGRAEPTLSTARRRVDNYAAGFIAAGASVVIAEASPSVPAYYIRAVFRRTASLATVWRTAPTSRGHVTTFRSARTAGATGRTDPTRTKSGFYRSIAGWPSTSTTDVRGAAPAPTPTPTPTPTPPVDLKTVTVSSIPALKSALADNSVDMIVVANGTYYVSPSNQAKSDSLWIGDTASGGMPFAERTRPITVRAETIGGVTFDGAGGSGYGGLSFEAGAHDQTWDGFRFANMRANNTGIIEIGGYTTRAAPHHITLRNITILASNTGRATTADGSTWDHGIYIGQALAPGPHDLLFENITVNGEGGLATAFHFFHGADNGGFNAHDVVIRRLTVTGTQQAIVFWEPSVYNVTVDTATITNAKAYAVRYETIGNTIPYNIRLNNITSTGSGYQGFYSTLGTAPPGISFSNSSLR